MDKATTNSETPDVATSAASTPADVAPPVAEPASPVRAPSTPPSMGSPDVSKSSKKTRKKRRKAVTEDEDIAILKAIAEVKPHSAEWGLTRKRWQQVVQLVVAEVGADEMTAQLAQRRYEILVNRFVVRQELGRPWPSNEKLRELLAEAVEEKKQREKKKKDSDDNAFVAKREKKDPSTPAIVDGDFHDDDGGGKTLKREAVDESEMHELKEELETLKTRLEAVEEEKVQRTEALAALMAAQSTCQSENEALRKDVTGLQLMLRDVTSLAGTLQSLRGKLQHQETDHETTVKEQNECMERIIMESVDQQRRIEELEATLASEREERLKLEDIVKTQFELP